MFTPSNLVRSGLKAFLPGIAAILSLPGCTVDTYPSADTIYVGGDILTMNDAQPTAEAVAVRGGEILAVGLEADVMKTRGAETTLTDLGGATLMPGFIDAHSHFFNTGLKLATVNLDPPPAGDVESIADIVRRLSAALAERSDDDDHWLIGWGYDNGMLEEGRHPTRDDLDAISTEVPILLAHFSSHMAVVNSRGLALGGIDAESIPPEGGFIQRKPGSREPNGILEETAMFPVQRQAMGQLTGDPEQVFERLQRTQELYASRGFTTMTEMAARPEQVALMREAGERGLLELDLLATVIYLSSTAEATAEHYSESYTNHFRVAGGKVVLDGGSPGRTAFLREPYHRQLPGQQDYRGYPAIERQTDVNNLIASYYAEGIPVFIHALGDAALDQCIEAVAHAEARHPGSDRRTQIIHLQQVQEDQFDQLGELDTSLTFQVTHNFYFADFHAREIYGPDRTARLNPIASALSRGLSATIHHDSPVHPVDPFMLLWNVVARESRSGRVWGPNQRVSMMDALKASTISAAYQFHEDDRKGSIEVGKLADLVILDKNPLNVAKEDIRSLTVLETIKEGRTVYTLGKRQ